MKVLFCLNSAVEFAGVQQYILTIALELKNRGFIPIVWLNSNELFEKKLLDNEIQCCPYKGSSLSIRNIWELVSLIRKNQIKIVHTNLGGSAIVGAIVKYPANIKKLVYTQHFMNPASTQSNIIKRLISKVLFKMVFYNYNSVIAISSEVKNKIIKRNEVSVKKVCRIYNGIKGVEGGKITPEIPNILIVSRLEEEKGVDKLIPIFSKLGENGFEFSVTVVGEGSQKKILEQMVTYLRIEQRVIFIGKVSDVSPYYLKASIFINPTLYEGFGLAIVEAMSAKLPVIAFNKGGPKDIVENGKTGYLVETYDEFGQKLERLFNDVPLSERMGIAGYERYKDLFTVDKMMEQLMEIYEI